MKTDPRDLGRGVDGGRLHLATRLEDQAAVAAVDHHRLPISDPAGENLLGEAILHLALDHPLQRPRAIGRIVALVGEPVARRGGELER